MIRSKTALHALLVLAMAAGDSAAFAADDPKGTAQALFDDAMALFNAARVDGDKTKYEAVLNKLQAAYALDSTPGTLASIALTEERLGRYTDAMHHFRQVLRNPNAKPDAIKRARTNMETASKHVGSVEVRAPVGAEILVDGTSTGEQAPLADPLDLLPGKHSVAARLGDQVAVEAVEAIGGVSSTVTLEVRPKTSTTSPALSEPGTVDSFLDRHPSPAPQVDQAVVPPRPPYWNARRVVGAGVVGAGIVSFVLYAVFRAQADSDASRAAGIKGAGASCSGSRCTDLEDAYSAQDRDASIGNAFLGMGIGAAVVGAGIILWPSPSPARVSFVPTIHPHGMAMGLGGEF
jgi:hypothetical protein